MEPKPLMLWHLVIAVCAAPFVLLGAFLYTLATCWLLKEPELDDDTLHLLKYWQP